MQFSIQFSKWDPSLKEIKKASWKIVGLNAQIGGGCKEKPCLPTFLGFFFDLKILHFDLQYFPFGPPFCQRWPDIFQQGVLWAVLKNSYYPWECYLTYLTIRINCVRLLTDRLIHRIMLGHSTSLSMLHYLVSMIIMISLRNQWTWAQLRYVLILQWWYFQICIFSL